VDQALDHHEHAQARQRYGHRPFRVWPPPLADAGSEGQAELHRDEHLHGDSHHDVDGWEVPAAASWPS
jgi:hypothetical protein